MEKSCGTVPYTRVMGEIRYLLIKTRDGKYCGFPKGHVEHLESETATALRETLEETSVKVEIIPGLRYETVYNVFGRGLKRVVYFPAFFEGQTPCNNEGFEKFDYAILPYGEAYDSLTYESNRKMLKRIDGFLKGMEKR